MSIINGIVKLLLKDRLSDIAYFRDHPLEAQEKLFHALISDARHTEWGKKYGYSSIKSFKKYQERVPISDYDDFKPYIDRMLKGEENILWHSPVRWFSKSSGTTSDRSKFIPASKEALEGCHYKAGKDLMACYADLFPKTKLFKGKCLVIGGSHQVSQNKNNIYYGDLSAVLLQNLSFVLQYFRTPSLAVALMDDWEKKMELMANESKEENVTYLSGVPSWTIVLIKKLFEITGKNNLLEIWPDLQLYIHGGVSFTPYKEQFKQFIPSDKMNYFETYNASEGFFAFQDERDADDMLLLTDNGVYYEFIPFSELDKEHPKTIGLADVNINENYAIVISTNAGLWRYMIGDTIKFTSKFPFKIQVSGRVKHFINAFGEEVIIDNAERAISEACKKNKAIVSEFTAAPVYLQGNESGCHEWVIEFEKEPDNLEKFKADLDSALKSINSDYEAKRYNDYVMKAPLIKKAPKGVFYQWLKINDKLGGQHKVPRLSNNRKYIDEILHLIN